MSVKKSKQKNTRHHVVSAPLIAKKKTAKDKIRNQDLRSKLDQITGLAGAANLFITPKQSQETEKSVKSKKIADNKAMEDDLLTLMTMKLSSTNTK
jgi:hypothetical protein